MALDNEALEAAAAGAFENAFQGGTIEILNAGASIIASGAIPASNDKNLASGNGVVANSALITITPSSSDTASTVQIKDAGGDIRSTYSAASVLNSVNVVLGNNITVAIGSLSVTATQ